MKTAAYWSTRLTSSACPRIESEQKGRRHSLLISASLLVWFGCDCSTMLRHDFRLKA